MINLDFLSNDYKDKRTYAEKVFEEIVNDIINGKLRSGSRVIEQNLCDKYHMSRTPVREILNRLSQTGLVELIPNRGAFVRSITERDIDDMWTAKYQLFPQMVSWAIERIDEKGLSMLGEVYNFMEFYAQTEDINKLKRIKDGFDLIIYDACGNYELYTIISRFDYLLKAASSDIEYPPGYVSTVFGEYSAIYDAFITRDPNAGYDAAEAHLYKAMLRRK